MHIVTNIKGDESPPIRLVKNAASSCQRRKRDEELSEEEASSESGKESEEADFEGEKEGKEEDKEHEEKGVSKQG